MRDDIRNLLERQAAWQRTRAEKPWAQKLKESVIMRRAMMSIQMNKKRSDRKY